MTNNYYNQKFNKPCAVCGKDILVDQFGQGECPHCNWFNNFMGEENDDKVIFPNLVSFNKAKKLYNDGKPFKPSLSEFLEVLYFYSEMAFIYNDIEFCLFRTNNEYGIEFCWSANDSYLFANNEDFIKNAKIGDEYVRDIWDQVEDPRYM